MESEIWKDIPGYEGYYQASDKGRIKSLERTFSYYLNGKLITKNNKEKVLKLTVKTDKRLIKDQINKREYVDLQINNIKKNHTVHKLVALTFIGPRPEGKEIAHYDGNSLNNSLGNLRYATPSENTKDKVRHGTQPFGENVPGWKLTDAQCLDILKSNETHAELSRIYNVSDTTIRNIRSGKKRKNLLRSKENRS